MKIGDKQLSVWTREFGSEYTMRNDLPVSEMEAESRKMLGKTYGELFRELLGKYRPQKILEVGCNLGKKLEIWKKISPEAELFGIEPQKNTVVKAHRRLPKFKIIAGNAYDLPFKDGFFDLVFTAGVLIHIPPPALPAALTEMLRVSRKYIIGLEFWEKRITAVSYRGKKNLLWRADYPREFLKHFSGLKLVKEIILPYKKEAFGKSGLFLNCYLLEKCAA